MTLPRLGGARRSPSTRAACRRTIVRDRGPLRLRSWKTLAPLPPVAASTSPSLRSTIDTAATLLTWTPQRSCPTRRQSRRPRLINAMPPKASNSDERRKQRLCIRPNRKTEFQETALVGATEARWEYAFHSVSGSNPRLNCFLASTGNRKPSARPSTQKTTDTLPSPPPKHPPTTTLKKPCNRH